MGNAVPRQILVIDDSKLIRHLGKSALERAGYRVTTADGLTEADKWLQQKRVDLLLVDINMPEMTGDDMVPHLRERLPVHVPVVLFSDIKEEELKHRAESSGADGFISKHWGLQRMVEDVTRFIRYSDEAAAGTEAAPAAAAEETGSAPTSRAPALPPGGVDDSDITQSARQVMDAAMALPGDSDGETTPAAVAPLSDGDAPEGSRGQLLLIDDSGLILKLAHRALTRHGYKVAIASSFDEINNVLKEIDQPDLILIDINMPEVLGDDLVVFFRRRWEIKSPIVLFSNVPEKELDYRAKEAGANGWISKRWGIERLVEEVDKYVS